MIKVELQDEPVSFDHSVRKPGLDAIRELIGEPTLFKRPGRKRKKIAASRDEIPPDSFPPLWRNAMEDMYTCYKQLCAFTALHIPRGTGSRTIDHMRPKSRAWDRVYEWNNYRLACGLANSIKSGNEDLLDPAEIENGWFVLEFVAFQVMPSSDLNHELRERIQHTIDTLGLNNNEFCKAREEYFCRYRSGDISMALLFEWAPFVAMEMRRVNLL